MLNLGVSLYKIFDVPATAAESTEQLGTKFKFWYWDKAYGRTLFKEGRPGTGENWAEKISCELAGLLGMPHAIYEFARYRDKEGVISRILVSRGARLIHGNEILATTDTSYGEIHTQPYGQRDHTIRRVLGYFRASADLVGAPYGFVQTRNISTALDVFIGYLMFDVWIANQDRHDQNWALLKAIDGNTFLSPSYDHGSSMGRNENDQRRATMLTTKDHGQHISKYILSARSAFYPQSPTEVKAKALFTLDAFLLAARQSLVAAKEWQHRLAAIDTSQIKNILGSVPQEVMTDTAKVFTEEFLKLNRQRILDCTL